jgi:hypothetical protein
LAQTFDQVVDHRADPRRGLAQLLVHHVDRHRRRPDP